MDIRWIRRQMVFHTWRHYVGSVLPSQVGAPCQCRLASGGVGIPIGAVGVPAPLSLALLPFITDGQYCCSWHGTLSQLIFLGGAVRLFVL